MSQVTVLNPDNGIPLELVLHDIKNTEGVEAVVCVVKIDGAWSTTWGGDVTAGSLSMAAMKLMRDVMHENEDTDSQNKLRRI